MLNNTTEKKHIFISYSRADGEFLQRLSDSLRSLEIPIWIDVNDLQPGTPNWQKAIRTAVKSAHVMILVASPNCATSEFIQAEIELAKAYDVPIIPVWMHGDIWIECVPLQLVGYQNIDCRGLEYSRGLENLSRQLSIFKSKTDSKPRKLLESHVTLILPNDTKVAILPDGFENIKYLLNTVYLRHLKSYYETFTYGLDWIMISKGDSVQRISAPWNWMLQELRGQPLTTSIPNWREKSPSYYGFVAGSVWQVVEPRSLTPWTIDTNSPYLAQLVRDIAIIPEKADVIRDLLVGFGQSFAQIQDAALKNVLASSINTFQLAKTSKDAKLKYKLLLSNDYQDADGFVMRIEQPDT